MKNKKKIIIYSIVVVLFLLVVFILSSANAADSNILSKSLIKQGMIIYEKIFNEKINKELFIIKLNYPIRKIAHFTEYFILAILIYKLLFYLKKNINLIYFNTIMLCLFFATIDEFHQLFVANRTGRFLDILIDTSGSILATFIIYIIKVSTKKKNRQKSCKQGQKKV